MFRNGDNAEVYVYDPGHCRTPTAMPVQRHPYGTTGAGPEIQTGSTGGYVFIRLRGVFFSTFYGIGNQSKGKDTAAYFAKFAISTTYIGP